MTLPPSQLCETVSINAMSSLGLRSARTTLQTVGGLAEAARTAVGLKRRNWERLRKLSAFSLKKRWFIMDLPSCFSCLRRGYREEGMRLLGSHHQLLKRQQGKVTNQKILIRYTENIFHYEGGQTVGPEELPREVLSVETFST